MGEPHVQPHTHNKLGQFDHPSVIEPHIEVVGPDSQHVRPAGIDGHALGLRVPSEVVQQIHGHVGFGSRAAVCHAKIVLTGTQNTKETQ